MDVHKYDSTVSLPPKPSCPLVPYMIVTENGPAQVSGVIPCGAPAHADHDLIGYLNSLRVRGFHVEVLHRGVGVSLRQDQAR